MDRSPPDFHDQFVLSGARGAVPDGWVTRKLAGWTLASPASLPVRQVLGSGGETCGWLLGWAVNDQSTLISEDQLLPGSGWEALEAWLYSLGGRFALAAIQGAEQRFYLDPCGTLSAVYEAERAALASTLTLLRFDRLDAFASSMAGRDLGENQFFPAGLTAEPAVRRLLPNHYLDLRTWRPVRHWPLRPVVRLGSEETGAAVRTIATQMQSIIQGLSHSRPAYQGLTAGRDSRMLLACARSCLDRLRFVTFRYTDEKRRPDSHIARRLSRRFGLDHVVIPLIEPTLSQRQHYQLRTGYVGHWGKARDFDLSCRRYLDMDRAWITGFGGEVGRGFYWRGEGDQAALTPEVLMSRLFLPPHPGWPEAWRQWQAGVPCQDAHDLLDLVYIEQRMGCWAGPHMYGAAPFTGNVSAFNHRRVIEAMRSLPVEFGRTQKLADAVLGAVWPELLDLPFQELTGLRRLWDPLELALLAGGRRLARGTRRALRRAIPSRAIHRCG